MSQESDIQRSSFTTILIMICTLVSRSLGFVRLIVVTTFFSQEKADIINLAFSIPNNLRKLLAEGALSSAFIPVLSANLVDTPDGSNARKLVSSIVNLQILVILPLCLLAIIFSEFLISEVLSEFNDPEQIAATANLFRWVIGYLLLISISAVLMGVLNTHHRFIVPAITPILFSVAVILCILTLRGKLDIYVMAVGVLAGGTLQILFQYPQFHRLGYRFRFNFDFKNPEFRKVIRRWLPILATSSVFAITQQVAIRFASGLGDGSVTAVSIALVFFQLPFGIFSAAITTVMFPRMSRQAARNDSHGLKESLQYGLRYIFVLLVPSAVFLCLNSRQLIGTGFLQGEFKLHNVLMAAPVLVYYSIGLFSVGSFTYMQRFFYSRNEYKTTFFVTLALAAADIGLSLWLKETELRTGGIALANTISFSLAAFCLLIIARKRLGSIEGRKIGMTIIKVCISMAPAAVLVILFNRIIGPWWENGRTLVNFVLIFCSAGLFSGAV
ncbi:MAG: murein biosynthesis integral membrane protein MurJ, partial [Spirochaetales bacterium]|nr:murein biosynthesis integral membrane protein MurJ [Spirochaetales bacterium]